MAVDKSNLYKEGSMSWVYGGSKKEGHYIQCIESESEVSMGGSWEEWVHDITHIYYIYCGGCGSLNVNPIELEKVESHRRGAQAAVVGLPALLGLCVASGIYGMMFSYVSAHKSGMEYLLCALPEIILVGAFILLGIRWLIQGLKSDVDNIQQDRYNQEHMELKRKVHGEPFECLDCHEIFGFSPYDNDNPKNRTKGYMVRHHAYAYTITEYDVRD